MKSLHVTMSEDAMVLLKAESAYAESPLSIWARTTLIEAARASAHKRRCATPKEEAPMWAGRPCTREYMDARQKEYDERMERAMNKVA